MCLKKTEILKWIYYMGRQYLQGFCFAASFCFAATNAFAFDVMEDVRLSGFGSVVGGITDESQEFGWGYDDNLRFDPETRFALQADIQLGKNVTATLQALSQGEDQFDTNLDWAFLSFQLTPSLRMSAGKLRVPFFLYSDVQEVGAVHAFAQPPVTMYDLFYNTVEGVSFTHNAFLGDWDLQTHFLTGATTQDSDQGTVELDDFYALRFNLSNDWISFILGAVTSFEINFPLPTDTFINGLVAAGESQDAADRVTITGEEGEDTAIWYHFAISAQPGNYIINYEYVWLEGGEAPILTTEITYLLIGYRLDALQPYIMYEQSETDRNTTSAGTFVSPISQAIAQSVLDAFHQETKGISVGIKADYNEYTTLKAQLTHYYDLQNNNPSTPGEFGNAAEVNQLIFGIDFMF